MRRLDSITATIALTVVVAMVLGFTLQRVVATALPYFGFERRQELPKVEERFLLQLPGRVAALLDILDRTAVADRPTILAAAQIPQVHLRLLDAPAPNLGNRGEPDAEVYAPSHRSGPYHATTGYRGRSLSARGRESRAGRWTRRERYLDRGLPCERAMAPRREQLGSAASERPGGG